MKLLRFGPKNHEKPGLLDNSGRIRDLSSIVTDINGTMLSPESLSKINHIDPHTLPLINDEPRIGACVGNVGKFLCIGLNYRDHVAETGKQVPREPVLFSKATSAIVGPYDNIIIPKHSQKTDWEVELGIIIGTPGKYIEEKNALDHIAGFCVINDISERAFQLEGTGQWTKGKSCDTFGPIGPWLVTKDEIPNPQHLKIWLEVDGHRYQNSNTSEMIWNVAFIVSYLSQFFTLHPGDIISTGTPAGVGLGQKPPVFLKPGQTIKLGIEGLGEQMQKTIAEE